MNERDNHLHTVELSEEQNDNMLDGILNNLPPSPDRKSTRLNSSHLKLSRMPSSA